MNLKSFCICLVATFIALPLTADDWPNYRGPNHNGISSETGWSKNWTAIPPTIRWRAKVGLGFSSFAVVKDKVFTFGNDAGKDVVFCLNAETGAELWRHSYRADRGARFYQGGTHSTPAVDGDTVYVMGKQGELFALSTDTGSVKWSKQIMRELGLSGRDRGTWGFGGSPLVHENLLILNAGGAGAAFDKATGKVVWRSTGKAGHSTPVPYEVNGESAVAIFGGFGVSGVATKNGRQLWTFPWKTQYEVNAVDPVFFSPGKTLFVSSGYDVGGAMLNLNGQGTRPVWRNKNMMNHFQTCVLIAGHLYGIHGHSGKTAGELRCVDARSGRALWRDTMPGLGGISAADGHLILLGERGTLMIAPASRTAFKPVGRLQVLGGTCWTAPVLANSSIYCRNGRGDVVCVDVSKN
jgi:outer membrane protein assembly factor BamB